MEVRYFGWSGVAVAGQGAVVAVDPFGDSAGWSDLDAASTVLCITHGHPEHCGSLLPLLRGASGESLARTHVLTSRAVIKRVARGGLLPADHLHALAAGGAVELDGLRVTAFGWRHLPLLPPESLRAKAEHLASLLRHPVEALRIAAAGLRLPMRAPYLGFHMSFPDGSTVLNYAEGLHRLTDPEEVASVAHELPAHTLIFAVEPEDVEAVPRWVEMLGPREVLLYEAHRPWRELFGLPYLDLAAYAAELDARLPEISFRALVRPGQRVTLGPATPAPG